MTACAVLALAISTSLGVPSKYVPGVLFRTMSRLRRIRCVDQAAPLTIVLDSGQRARAFTGEECPISS